MKQLEEMIRTHGSVIGEDILLVDSFLNHQVDVKLMQEIGKAFAGAFEGLRPDLVVTVESSGIAPAAFTALSLGLPLVIMKKQTSRILTGNTLQVPVHSFTKGTEYMLTVKQEYLPKGRRVLVIDDFLASGEAAFGVMKLLKQAQMEVAGIGIVIEKSFQSGRALLEKEGIRVCSLARIDHFDNGTVVFREADR